VELPGWWLPSRGMLGELAQLIQVGVIFFFFFLYILCPRKKSPPLVSTFFSSSYLPPPHHLIERIRRRKPVISAKLLMVLVCSNVGNNTVGCLFSLSFSEMYFFLYRLFFFLCSSRFDGYRAAVVPCVLFPWRRNERNVYSRLYNITWE
jgi:hypothetical protein